MQNSIGKLTINDLEQKIFVIPFYQRGYRWTENEAKKLFNDLLEFASLDEKQYCLQPIVLQTIESIPEEYKKNPQYSENTQVLRVVDGQQRLTTIAILLNVLGISKEWDIYYTAERNTLSPILSSGNTETINAHFIKEVKKAFEGYDEEKKENIRELLRDSRKTILFLRYDIPLEGIDSEGHQAFLRLNDGKTPLTSSELIRALYMVNASELSMQERMEISKEWEIIENTLRNEQFWLMFNSKGLSNTPTRIDLLFALVLGVSLEHAKANPRIVFEKMDDIELNLREVWLDVLRCFWWMQSCYDDVEQFNYLGWINEFTDISAKTIYDNWRSYPKPEDFKKCIIAIIQEKYRDKTFDDFNYTCEKGELRALFVLLNVLDCNRSKERFRFDLYQNESWDIEHIDSQTPNELEDDSSRTEWLLSVWKEFSDLAELNKIDIFKNFNEKNISLDNFESQFYEIRKQLNLNDDFDGNALGNLALLNTSINRSYKNAIFPAKRKTIKNFVVSGECYIPPCTAKVFMKFYTESPSKITYWLKDDFIGYSQAMEEIFTKFMKDLVKIESNKMQNPKDYKGEKVATKNQDRTQCYPAPVNDAMHKEQVGDQGKISDAIAFSDFMNKYGVVIPKIQRLYVQGRMDSYGKKCLFSFANHLVRSVAEQESAPLDFIYGIESKSGEREDFYPLDGQQRLTTLLLHAWLCGEARGNWSFRYDSRRATECFIKALLGHAPPPLMKPNDYEKDKESKSTKGYLPLCSNYIKNSDWFLSAWEEDAGIAGMLEMLDSLYCKLLDSGNRQFDFSRITFFVNYLDASKESYDQIFLKMNSRGKALTPWENIKAILDKYVPDDFRAQWQENLNNTWQELLWNRLDDDQDKIAKLDSKMLSIIELALPCVGYTERAKDNIFSLAQWLEQKDNKTKCEFYKICSIFFSALEYTPDNDGMTKALTPAWEESPKHPNFKKDSADLFYKPLLAYYAAKQSTDGDWMRIVWNIVENSGIEKNNFPSAYALVKELATHKDSILDFMAGTERIESKFASDQVNEERLKAKQIVDPPKDCKWNCHGPNRWEIQCAEKTAFFNGAIRFLYLDANGNVDWSQFKTKFENARKYFADTGVIDDCKLSLTKALLSQCKSWDQVYDKQIFDPCAANWKHILLSKKYAFQIHMCLSTNDLNEINHLCMDNDPNMKSVVETLINNENFLEKIIKNHCDFRFRWNYNYLALYAPYGRDAIAFDWGNNKRNITLTSLSDHLKITNKQVVDKVNLFWGWDINFSYKNNSFQWNTDGQIYLMRGRNDYARRTNPTGNNKQEKFFCFDSKDIEANCFIDQLDRITKSFDECKEAAKVGNA